MAGCFLAVIYLVPLAQSVVEIAAGRLPQAFEIFERLPTRPTLRAYEKQLEQQSVFANAARPWMQYAWFALLGNAGENVLVGRKGWLFYRPDVRYLVEQPARQAVEGSEDPAAAIVNFRDQLQTRGIHLLVVPAPGKPSLYGGMLTRRLTRTSKVQSPTLSLIARLRDAGVETVDLFELFSKAPTGSEQPYYLARDTHWLADAAEVAAAAVAARIEEKGWVKQGAVDYEVRPIVVHRRSDIARMTRVPLIEASFPAEEVASRQVFEKATGEKYKDDPESPVLVLGDSFLRMYQTDEPTAAGFIAHLARCLRRPVASIVNDGGASTLVRQELARRPQLLRGKKVVVWEFVERDIRFGMEGWKPTPLPAEPTGGYAGALP
jgi:SGNH hydrolase-like domain, acetyltransferase AlgX